MGGVGMGMGPELPDVWAWAKDRGAAHKTSKNRYIALRITFQRFAFFQCMYSLYISQQVMKASL